jgi:hypothetical protein
MRPVGGRLKLKAREEQRSNTTNLDRWNLIF